MYGGADFFYSFQHFIIVACHPPKNLLRKRYLGSGYAVRILHLWLRVWPGLEALSNAENCQLREPQPANVPRRIFPRFSPRVESVSSILSFAFTPLLQLTAPLCVPCACPVVSSAV